MNDVVLSLPTLEELSTYVHKKLCEFDSLDVGQTPIHGVALTRGGRACGMVFHVEGPRVLRTSAVWAAEDHRILFYDSTGRRVGVVMLSESPDTGKSARVSNRRAA